MLLDLVCSGWAEDEVSERLAGFPRTTFLGKPYATAALVAAFAGDVAEAVEATSDRSTRREARRRAAGPALGRRAMT